MDVQTLRTLVEYTQQANHKVWACIDELSDEQFLQAHDYSIGGIYDQTFHMMMSDWYMPNLDAIVAGKATPPKKEDFTTWSAIKAEWAKIDADINTTLNNMTDADLQAIIKTPVSKDLTLETPRWEMWMSYVNHNTNHRAQVLARLHQLGAKTVEQGYYFYLIDRHMALQTV